MLLVNRDIVLSALGKVETRSTATWEFEKAVRALGTYDTELDSLVGRAPVGTVYVSLPFNTPLYSLVLYCAGPLLAGNSVVFRPSRHTSMVVREILASTPTPSPLDLREFVGSGPAFISEAAVSAGALVFTGSWNSVSRLRESFSRLLIYCGPGVNPFVILEDADLTAAMPSLLRARLINSGQDCLSTERVYIHRSRLTEVREQLTSAVQSLVVSGDPHADVGPLTSEEACIEVERLWSSPHPGREWDLPPRRVRRLVYPSVAITDDGDPLVRAEKFAPVFVLVPFDSPEELNSQLANGDYFFGVTIYGSSGWSDLELPYPHIAHDSCLITEEGADAHVPFGGARHSGFVQDRGRLVKDGPILFSVETSRLTSPPSSQTYVSKDRS